VRRTVVRNGAVVAAVLLSGLLTGETGAAFRNPDGVALIIGNRAYKYDVPQVTYAHRDAEAFRRYVVDVLGFDPENVIHEKDADKATLERIFGNRDNLTGSELWRRLHQDGNSDVVVFYSGHGIPGLNDKRGYLLPVNAHPDTAELNGYPIDVLYDNLVKLKEQKAVRSVHVFLDACFSGDSGGGRLIGATSAIRVAPLRESSGLDKLTILTAASGKEVASWDKTAKHGLFTHHLLDALYGGGDADADGQVTAAEAKAYLDRHMTRAARRTFGRVQNADLRGVETAVLARAVGGMFPVRPGIVPERQPGQRFRDCPTCPEMVVVPAGSYEMGSPASEEGRFDLEGPVHRVTIADPFAVGMYEVTRAEFGRFVEATGYSTGDACLAYESGKFEERSGRLWRDPGFAQTDQHPVVCVSWEDAQGYVRWLSQETGQAYRLLSEAEWEYVARAGTTTPFHTGATISTKQANYDGNYAYGSGRQGVFRERTVPVGLFSPNAFGLYDVHGNVWEWVADCWNESYRGAPTDGIAWVRGDCSRRVLRGGAWGNDPLVIRSATRIMGVAGSRYDDNGFRVARAVGETFPVRPLIDLKRQPGQRFRNCPTCPEMVVVPVGRYEMGSQASEAGRNENEGPVHRVTLEQSFAVGIYEVTRGEFGSFVDATGYSTGNSCFTVEGELEERQGRHWRDPGFAQTDQHPVVCVSWEDAQAYVRWLSQETGQGYRLLSEAEWEYVARAGTRTARYWGPGESEQCQYVNGIDEAAFSGRTPVGCHDGYVYTSPVGKYTPNAFGLHDVLGNVFEWVADCRHESYRGAPSDGSAWENGACSRRVLRGGAWVSGPKHLRSASRSWGGSRNRNYFSGFRVARTLN